MHILLGLVLFKIFGFYMLAISLIGVLAPSKSSFLVALLVCPIFVAAGCGSIA